VRGKRRKRKASLVLALSDSVFWWFLSAGILKVIGGHNTNTSPLLSRFRTLYDSYTSTQVVVQALSSLRRSLTEIINFGQPHPYRHMNRFIQLLDFAIRHVLGHASLTGWSFFSVRSSYTSRQNCNRVTGLHSAYHKELITLKNYTALSKLFEPYLPSSMYTIPCFFLLLLYHHHSPSRRDEPKGKLDNC